MGWVLLYLLLTLIFFFTLIGLIAMWTGIDANRKAEQALKRAIQ